MIARNIQRKEDIEMLILLRRMAATLHRQWVRRITIGELSALSDLALTDIGVERSQIRSVVEDLLQGTGRAQVRLETDVEAQAAAADLRTPSAYDREHRLAA